MYVAGVFISHFMACLALSMSMIDQLYIEEENGQSNSAFSHLIYFHSK